MGDAHSKGSEYVVRGFGQSGRDIARHNLYPADYTPKRVTQRQLFREFLAECRADVLGHKWFWFWVTAATGFLVYHVVKLALSIPGAMRIGQ